MTFEELVAEEVKKQLKILLPAIEERLAEKYIFKQMNQTVCNQVELAKRWNVSTTTIWTYRKLGLPYYYTKTGALEFNIAEAEKWKQNNK